MRRRATECSRMDRHPDHTSNYATCSGTSRHTHSRWTERTIEPSRVRSAKRWPNTSPSSSWMLSPPSNVSIWTPAHWCSDSCCSHSCAQNADSPQHRAAAWRFIDWNEVEQRELLAEAKRLLKTGELFPRGTAEEPHAPDAEAEATDSEPEAHVLVPLADDHSSGGEDTPIGVEESAAPAAPAVAAAPESSHESA